MQRGFTLPELAIAMTIVALLFTAAVPNLSRTFDSYRIKSTVRELQGLFLLAKSEAIKANRDIWVQLRIEPAKGEQHYQLQLLTKDPSQTSITSVDILAQTDGIIPFIKANRSLVKVKGINGKFAESGHLQLSRQANGSNSIKLIFHHITGRVRLCSVKEASYGYPLC